MKLQMKREALEKINRRANEMASLRLLVAHCAQSREMLIRHSSGTVGGEIASDGVGVKLGSALE